MQPLIQIIPYRIEIETILFKQAHKNENTL